MLIIGYVHSLIIGGALTTGVAEDLYDSAATVPEGLLSITLPPNLFNNLIIGEETVGLLGETSGLLPGDDISVLFNTYDSSTVFPISNETQYRLANISDPELVGQFQVASSLVSATVIGYDVLNLPNNTKVTIILKLQSNVSL